MASIDWQKQTTQQAGAMVKHLDQQRRMQGNHSNTDIDPAKTPGNYTLGPTETYMQGLSRMTARTKEVDAVLPPQRIRKDRVTSVALSFPCPAEIEKTGRSREFMEATYDTIERFFGSENVHHCIVHVDEKHTYLDHGEEKESLIHAHVLVSAFVPQMGINGKNFQTRARMKELNNLVDSMCFREFGVHYNTGETPRREKTEVLKNRSDREAMDAKKKDLEETILVAEQTIRDADKREIEAQKAVEEAEQKAQEVTVEYEEKGRKLVEMVGIIELAETEKANADAEKAKSERAAEEAKKVQAEAEKQKEIALESLDATVAIAQIEGKKRVKLSREEQEKLAKNAIAVEQLEARERAVAEEKRSIEAQKAGLKTEKNRLRELCDKVSEKASELKKLLAETLGKRSLRRLIASICIDFVVEVFDFFTREIANEYVSDDKKDTYDEQCRETKKQIRGLVADKLRIPENELLDTADINAELTKLRDDDPADRSKNRFESAYDHDNHDGLDDHGDYGIER